MSPSFEQEMSNYFFNELNNIDKELKKLIDSKSINLNRIEDLINQKTTLKKYISNFKN